MDSNVDYDIGGYIINNNSIKSSNAKFSMEVDKFGVYRFKSNDYTSLLTDDYLYSYHSGSFRFNSADDFKPSVSAVNVLFCLG